jgi:hypothetical protein
MSAAKWDVMSRMSLGLPYGIDMGLWTPVWGWFRGRNSEREESHQRILIWTRRETLFRLGLTGCINEYRVLFRHGARPEEFQKWLRVVEQWSQQCNKCLHPATTG